MRGARLISLSPFSMTEVPGTLEGCAGSQSFGVCGGWSGDDRTLA